MPSPSPELPGTGRAATGGSPETPARAARRSASRGRELALACLAVALGAADTYVVVVALTDMMAGVGVGIESVQRATPIVSGFLIGYVIALPLVGRLSDVVTGVSRRTVLTWCLTVFVAGSVLTALASDLTVLVTGRLVQGFGAGGVVPVTLALVADHWAPQDRGRPLGAVGAVQEGGAVIGPLLGAGLVGLAGWRGIFWVNALVAVLIAGALSLAARESDDRPADLSRDTIPAERPARSRLSGWWFLAAASGLLGCGALIMALLAPRALTMSVRWGAPFVPWAGLARWLGSAVLATPLALGALVLLVLAAALSYPRWRHVVRAVDSPGVVLLALALVAFVLTFAVSDAEHEVIAPGGVVWALVCLLAAFGWWRRERRTERPVVPAGVLTRGGLVGALAVSACAGAALVAVVIEVPLMARLTAGADEVGAALLLVRFLIGVPIGAYLGGRMLARRGPVGPATVGLVVAAAGLAAMATWDTSTLVSGGVPPTLELLGTGIGLGLAVAPVNALALANSSVDEHGAASGLVVLARTMGMIAGLAALTAVGLRRYYATVQALPQPVRPAQLLEVAIVQVQTIFAGAAVLALLGSLLMVLAGRRRAGRRSASHPGGALGRQGLVRR